MEIPLESDSKTGRCLGFELDVGKVPMYVAGQSVRKMKYSDLTDKQKYIYIRYKEELADTVFPYYNKVLMLERFKRTAETMPGFQNFINFLIVSNTKSIEEFCKYLDDRVYELQLYISQNVALLFHKYLSSKGNTYIMEGNQLELSGTPDNQTCEAGFGYYMRKAEPRRKSVASYGKRTACAAKKTPSVKRPSVKKPSCAKKATAERVCADWDEDIRDILADDYEALTMWKRFVRKYKNGEM
jgi:hypothetical protein